MKYFYEILCTQYPSGMDIQRLNAASMFDIDEEYLIVGNGAAELINVLGKILEGTVSVGIPAFNEYIRCFESQKIRLLDNADNDYRMNMRRMLEEIDETDNLIIINPDNPSGFFFTKEEILQLLEKCEKKETYCIIDESFVDFADQELRFTLLNEQILEKYPHLIVIKSISKSYGIPGLRLGVMATADKEIRKAMLSQMAIWNINSLAEYYLQIQRLYKKSYIAACNKIAENRKYMLEQLANMKELRVFPSQANYIMCEVKGGITSGKLAAILMQEKNILIKDLSDKKGFYKKSYIRIAVKNEEDNQILLDALKEILTKKEEENAVQG